MADYAHQSTHSGALIGSNDDLLTEILRHLPVISVIRFKSVSKHWRSLLSHRHFSLLYDNVSVSPGLFVRNLYIPFDIENQTTHPFRSLNFYPDPRGIKIVQSCNGLLLCCSKGGNKRAHIYYVLNPTTKQFAIIPSVPGGHEVLESIRFMGLAFHPTDCFNYKVVCIHRERPDEHRLLVQIYSSDTRQWKKTLDDSFWASYYMPFSGGVYWNGAIHWAPSCLLPLYFKLDVERLKDLPLPSPRPVRAVRGYKDGARPLYFGESRGHLHFVETADHESYLHLNVYEMLSDHSGWFVKYRVDLDELRGAYPEMICSNSQDLSRPDYYEFEVLDVVRGEDDKQEDTFMVVNISKKIIWYNILDNGFKEIFDLTNTLHGNIGPWEVHRYTKSVTSF